MFKKIMLVVAMLFVMPMVAMAAENTATTNLRECLASSVTICDISGDIVLEEDLIIAAGEYVLSEDHEINPNGHTLRVVGKLGLIDLDNINLSVENSSLLFASGENAWISIYSNDNEVESLYMIGEDFYQSLPNYEDIPVIYSLEPNDDGETQLVMYNNGDTIVFYSGSSDVYILSDITFEDDLTIAESSLVISEGVNVINNANIENCLVVVLGTYTNNSNRVNSQFILRGEGKIINNGTINLYRMETIGNDTTIDNKGNINIVNNDFGMTSQYTFDNEVINSGTIKVVNSEDFYYYISIGVPFKGNDIVMDVPASAKVDYSERKNNLNINSTTIPYDSNDVGYGIIGGLLFYHNDSLNIQKYHHRNNFVTDISLLVSDNVGSSDLEVLVDKTAEEKLLTIEILDIKNMEFGYLDKKGGVAYNVGDYDSYLDLHAEEGDLDESNYTYYTKYFGIELEEEKTSGYVSFKIYYADGTTEIINLSYLKSEDGTEDMLVFAGNGGNYTPSVRAEDGKRVVAKPADPTKEGYIFDNWYADADFTTLYDFTDEVNEKTVVYAKWLEAKKDFKTATGDVEVKTENYKLASYKLVAEDITATFDKTALNEKLEEGEALIALNIYFTDANGNKVNVGEEKFEVRIRLTEDLKKYENYKIVFVDDEGKVVSTHTVRIDGDYLVVELNHFSNYVLTGTKIVENPDTSDNILLSIGLGTLSVLGLLGSAVVLNKKRFN